MDQKWTKRQIKRPPESPELDLRPSRKQVTVYSMLIFHIKDNGEAMCENKGYDPAQCAAVGCCHWNHVWKCRSSVGTNKCSK